MYRMINEKMKMSKMSIFNWLRHGAEFLENCLETIKTWLLKPGTTIYCDESWVDTKVTEANDYSSLQTTVYVGHSQFDHEGLLLFVW